MIAAQLCVDGMASHRTKEKKMAKPKKPMGKEPASVANNKSMEEDPKKSKDRSRLRSRRGAGVSDGTLSKRQKTPSDRKSVV